MDDEELKQLLQMLTEEDEEDEEEEQEFEDNEREREAEEELQKKSEPSSDSSVKPKGLSSKAKITGNLVQKGAANFGKAIMHTFGALMKSPVFWIVVGVIVAIIIIVVIFKSKADNTSDAIINNIDNYVEQDDTLSAETKAAYEESGSLLKFPLASINKLYDRFIEADFTEDVIAGYSTVMGTKDVEADVETDSLSNGQTIPITSGNTSWDTGGLENMDYESAQGEEITFECTFYAAINNAIEGGVNDCHGNPLKFGVLANNVIPQYSQVLLEGHGVFQVLDKGSNVHFGTKTRIDIFVARIDGESDSEYENRVNSYGRQTIRGKIIREGKGN